MKPTTTNWPEIRQYYETTGESLRATAVRFQVSERTLFRRSSKECWRGGSGNGSTDDSTISGNGSNSGSSPAESGSAIPENGSGTYANGSSPAENGSNANENGSTNGASTNLAAKSGSAEMAPLPKVGSTDGSNVLKNGSSDGTVGGSTAPKNGAATISADINTLDRVAAAQFYFKTLGWAIHPLYGPDRGGPRERGKKPIYPGWRQHTAADVTSDDLAKCFVPGTNHNIGCVVRPPFVHVDLDSKSDAGASVMEWLATMPELAAVPRERTGGGVHLAFICRDLPETMLKPKQAPTCKINDKVDAELYLNSLNLVLSPSVHKSGHQYTWEVTGEIPEVKWTDLVRWFGFATPVAKKPGRPPKELPWWYDWHEDLRTLDLTKVLDGFGMLGKCLSADEQKWAVRCPWESEHSGDANAAPGSDAIIFNHPATMPGFRCLHAHCAERSIKDLIEWLDERTPGVIAANCRAMRAWNPGQNGLGGRRRIILPGLGRPDSEFCEEAGADIGPRELWFRKGNYVCEVAVRSITEDVTGLVFATIEPIEAVTSIERFMETGVIRENEEGEFEFVANSMSREDAATLLASQQFKARLPEIIRILDVPIPIASGGEILFPKTGYDPRFRSYCPPDAPVPLEIGLDEARRILRDVHSEFCWKDEQSVIHAIARMITPYCRGIMGWSAKTPLWFYCANRPRAGKDYLAGVTQILYEGKACEDAPIGKDSEETRKRITTALMSGRRSMHFANCQEYLQDQCFIGAITSKTFAARNLGSTDAKADLILANEIEFSVSANVGLTFREDIEPRTRRLDLEFFEENPNGRDFRRPDLHGWIAANRPLVLGAVASVVRHWIHCGRPPGKTPFNSFPEWARVVGGIMSCCGLGDPCLPHQQSARIGGDGHERAMRAVYRIGYGAHPDEWITKQQLFEALDAAPETDTEALVSFMVGGELTSKEARMRIGKALNKFNGRHLEGIQMLLDDNSQSQRQRLMFRQPSPAPRVNLDQVFGTDPLPGDGQPSADPAPGTAHFAHFAHFQQSPRDGTEKPQRTSAIKNDELNGCYKETTGGSAQSAQSAQQAPRGIFCSSRSDLDRVAADLAGASRIALDIETYGPRKGDGLDPWKGDIRLLTLSRHGGTIWTIDLRATGYDLGPLKPILEETGIIAHNAKFDLLWLWVKCGLFATKVHCTLTAARILAAGTKPGNNLDQCLERYLGIKPAADHSRSDWASMLLTDDQLAYAARDVAYLHDLIEVMETDLEMAGLDAVWALESALLPTVVKMEATGIRVERGKLEAIAAEADRLAQQATADLRTALGNPSINPGSPGQVLAALRKAGLTLESTSEEALKAADDGRLIPLVLAHREASKRAQQAEALVGHIQQDGRIHGRFEPLGTATGRFSSKEPNLQNIGRGEMREAFTAPEGRRLIVADYSQIELRAAAAIAGETRMIEAYRAGADLHKLTASVVLGKPECEVTKQDRQTAKSSNFGLLYGQSAKGLVRYAATSYGVTLDEDQAQSIRQAFFRTYSRLRQWHGLSHQQAEAGVTEVRTRAGRRRLIPTTATDWERFTALVNTPVQGGTADGMKHALILIDQRLPKSARIVSTVHDEVVAECHEDTAEQCREIITTAMVEAMAALFPEVPVEVEANICTTWAEK
jgi:DNA polymerase-1